MTHSKLIKVFERQSWKILLTLNLPLLLIFMLVTRSPIFVMFILDIFFIFLFILPIMGSVIKVHEAYLICNNRLIFWKAKKLFDYHKIDFIKITYIRGESAGFALKIHHINGEVFLYSILRSQVGEFCNLMDHKKVMVLVESHEV